MQYTVGHDSIPAIPRGRHINVVDLKGVMLRDDGPCGQLGTRTLAAELLKQDANAAIVGHILFVDSGGGAANSVPDLAEAIQACQKPVVAFVDGYMCSAAMYAGSYCDSIIAHRDDDRIGCIGTMIQLEDWPKQVKEQDGFVHIRVYADGSDEKNSEYEKALEGNFALLKERILNPLNERFKADVKQNRPAATDDQLTGRTYDAKSVVGTLIDEIGGFDRAVNKVIELSNVKITKMEGLTHLQQIESCKDLQMVDDVVSLNQEQLNDIDKKLSEGSKVAELTEQLSQAQAQNSQLTSERDNLQEEVATKQTRIDELEAALEQSGKAAPVAEATHNGNHAQNDEFKEFTDEEAMDYCREILKK